MPSTFHPFKYKYQATALEQEGKFVRVLLSAGPHQSQALLPAHILNAQALTTGTPFTLCVQPEASLKETETETLKALLTELLK
jgi:hypothetical protein